MSWYAVLGRLRLVTAAPVSAPASRAAGRRAGAGVAVGGFVAVRVAGAVMVAVWARRHGRHPLDLLGLKWDALWYHRIAEWGYGTFVPSAQAPGMRLSDLAFFPLYPGVVRAVAAVLPGGSVLWGLAVAWACAALAAWGVYAVGEFCGGRRTATALVLLWGLQPHAVVLSMAYTEPMMCALAAWALYAVLTRRWAAAAALAVLAGLSRPNALAVPAAVLAAVAADGWRRRRAGQGQDPRAWVAALAAPLGWFGYVAWAGAQTGDGPHALLHGYFEVQARWGSRFDAGRFTRHHAEHMLLAGGSSADFLAAAVCAAAALLLVLAALDRMPAALLVYSAVLVAVALGGAGFFPSRPRFLLPAFPLLLPAAAALARARARTAVVVVAALAAVSLAYGTYAVVISPTPL